jgi:hypothetical protein
VEADILLQPRLCHLSDPPIAPSSPSTVIFAARHFHHDAGYWLFLPSRWEPSYITDENPASMAVSMALPISRSDPGAGRSARFHFLQ